MFTRNDKFGIGIIVGLVVAGIVIFTGGLGWLLLAGFFWLAWGDQAVSDLRWWQAQAHGAHLSAPGDDWIASL